jgi:serine/threonine-protein kinase
VGGRWRLLRPAGAGGEGTAWLAERTVGGPAQAVVKLRHADDAEARARVAREWAIASGLRHARLVHALDYGDDEQVGLWVAFELLGESAWTRLQSRGAFGAPDAVEAARQLLDGLEALHRAGVVHRDVKPQNLLRDPVGGGWKLGDFGIARVPEAEPLTDTAMSMGTWAWSAPEQRHSARSVTPAADVYGAGATLYSLVTGEAPFELHAVSRADLPLARLPSPIADVVYRATRLDPAERFPSAAAMRAALEGAPAPPRGRSGARIGAAALLGAAVLGAAGSTVWPPGAPAPAAPTAPVAAAPAGPAALSGAPVSDGENVYVELILGDTPPGARAGSALLLWTDPDLPAEPRLAVGAPGAGTGGQVLWVPDRRPGKGAKTRNRGQSFGAALASLRPSPRSRTTMVVVGGPTQDGHVYGYDPAAQAPWGWVFSGSEGPGRRRAGVSIADLGDVHGVGLATLAYGAPGAGPEGRGEVVLHSLRPDVSDVARLWGEGPGAALGAAVVAVDADGDGLSELFAGAPGGVAGAVYRVAPYAEGALPIADAADAVLRGAGAGDGLGLSLASAGDVDGDGAPELWVGAPHAGADEGRVYLLPAAWPGDAPAEAHAIAVLDGAAAGGEFGAAIAGDAREGRAPMGVAVAAPREEGGVVRVYDAQLRGAVPPALARSTWRGGVPGGRFGAALLLGADLDADGGEDLLVGAPGEGGGRVWRLPAGG